MRASAIWGYGEIGKHAGFKILCRKASRFKSEYPHHLLLKHPDILIAERSKSAQTIDALHQCQSFFCALYLAGYTYRLCSSCLFTRAKSIFWHFNTRGLPFFSENMICHSSPKQKWLAESKINADKLSGQSPH